ncbi:MAG: hypothetical protein WCV93_02100 [Candidatus Shapirobacteria bacterium]
MPKSIKLLLCLVLVTSAFFRLYRINDYAEFLGDQGRDVVIVRNFLKNGDPFFIGPQTSIGNMYLGPYYYYFFVAPGLFFTNFNPVGPAVIIALIGVLTTYLIFRFSALWFSSKVAVVSAFLYAISPVVIKYNSFSWNPNIMPLFSLLYFYFLTRSRLILATLAFIMALNSHYLALALLPLGFIILFFNRQKSKISLKSFIIPFLIFLISLIPQILFDIKHHGQNVNALITFFSQRETTVNLKIYKALPQIFPLFSQINTRLLAGKNETFGLIVSLLFAFLIIYRIFQEKRKLNRYFVFLLFWYLTGLIALALYKQHIYDHYFGFLFPVVFILFGYLISFLPRLLFIPIILAIAIFSFLENPLRWSAPRQLATTEQIIDSIIANSENKSFNFALLAKMNYDPGYRYFLSEKKAPVELLQNKVTDQLFVVCEPFQIDCNPINNPEWAVAAFGWAKIDSQWEINGIKIFRLTKNPSGLPPYSTYPNNGSN